MAHMVSLSHLDPENATLVLVFGALSIASCTLILTANTLVPVLRQPPGKFLRSRTVFLLLQTVVLMTFAVFHLTGTYETEDTEWCKLIQAFVNPLVIALEVSEDYFQVCCHCTPSCCMHVKHSPPFPASRVPRTAARDGAGRALHSAQSVPT